MMDQQTLKGLPCAKCYSRNNVIEHNHKKEFLRDFTATRKGATVTTERFSVTIPLCKNCKRDFKRWDRKYRFSMSNVFLGVIFFIIALFGLTSVADRPDAFPIVFYLFVVLVIPFPIISLFSASMLRKSHKSPYYFVPVARTGSVSVKSLYSSDTTSLNQWIETHLVLPGDLVQGSLETSGSNLILKCPHCGENLKDKVKYCVFCGKEIQ